MKAHIEIELNAGEPNLLVAVAKIAQFLEGEMSTIVDHFECSTYKEEL